MFQCSNYYVEKWKFIMFDLVYTTSKIQLIWWNSYFQMYIVIQPPLLEIEYNWEPKRLNQTWTNLLDSNRRHSNEPNKIYGEKCIPMTALCLDDFLLSKTNNLICYGLQITMIAFQWDHCTCIYILLYIYMYIYIWVCLCLSWRHCIIFGVRSINGYGR